MIEETLMFETVGGEKELEAESLARVVDESLRCEAYEDSLRRFQRHISLD